jgi:peptidoglycan hydrolase-like protein with peptidoglycan-binding domain
VAAVKPVLGSRVLSLGMKGADVEELLLLLVKKNLLTADRIPSDATFNANVETAVKSFQTAKGITVDGRVDFRTLLLLKAQ